MKKSRCIFLTVLFCLLFSNLFFGQNNTIGEKFSVLIKNSKLKEAKEFLKKKDMVYGSKILKTYYIKLGNAFISDKQYSNALSCFKAFSNPKIKTKRIIKKLTKLLGERYLKKRNYKKALEFFKTVGDENLVNRLSHVLKGDEALLKKKYDLALNYYKSSGFLDRIAKCYGIIADEYNNNGDFQLAKSFFKKAIEEYTSLLKSFDFIWFEEYNKDRLRCISKLKRIKKKPEDNEQKIILKKILKGAGTYSAKLRDESIYFYCKEFVKESRDYSVSGSSNRFDPDIRGHRRNRRGGRKNKTFINSYQLIQKGESIKETRQFLRNVSRGSKFSKKVNWKSASVVFQKIIFGPLGMLEFSWQPYNSYTIIGKETINNEKAIIIECIPEYPLEKKTHRFNNYLFGKIWISVNDYSVLKIEWEPKSIAFVNNTLNTVSLSSQTRFKYTIEYFLKRNGIRFPTKGYYSEYFVNEKGKKNIYLELGIKYSDFRFFNVATTSEHTIGEIE